MSFSSNSVVAKARAVLGRSLTAEDYTQLAAKESVPDVCAYLKQTARYGKALAAVNPQTVHRGQLEAVMRRSVFDIFESFHRFDYTESKNYFKYIVMQLEIEQIMSAIQCVEHGNADAYIAAMPMFLTEHTGIDLPALGMAESLIEALHILEGTPYFAVLKEPIVAAAETGRLDICECERRLYDMYYMRLLKAIEKGYRGAAKKELKRTVLRGIDMENVVSVHRYTVFFGGDAESVRGSLIPFRYRLTGETIERLAAEKDIARISAALADIGYRHGAETPQTVELLTERISLDYLRKTLRLSQNASVVYLALTELLEIELKNIKTLIEGIRYGLDGAVILNMLVI
ncbi:MAG: V-type ATPase subunit [Lachnospiraceae bacterium]|nr:V-type ATPase subunit [Ruminococcus sp.]MCM1275832.1 V-type ATPase subunit [Lachnospiraceae bacterium]